MLHEYTYKRNNNKSTKIALLKLQLKIKKQSTKIEFNITSPE